MFKHSASVEASSSICVSNCARVNLNPFLQSGQVVVMRNMTFVAISSAL